LWTESGHLNRPERNTPEIQRADLAEVVLLLHSMHIRKAAEFDWLDKPDPAAIDRAEKLLRLLGALDSSEAGNQTNRLTPHPSPLPVEGRGSRDIGPPAPEARAKAGGSETRRVGRPVGPV